MGGNRGVYLQRCRVDGDGGATPGHRDQTAQDRWQWDSAVQTARTETRLVDGKAHYTKGDRFLNQDSRKGVELALFRELNTETSDEDRERVLEYDEHPERVYSDLISTIR